MKKSGRKRKGLRGTRKRAGTGLQKATSARKRPPRKSVRPRKSARGSKVRRRENDARRPKRQVIARRRTAGTTSRRARKPAPARSLKAKILAKERAVREVGETSLKRGPLLIGETGWLTPTGSIRGRTQGVGAVRRAVQAITRIPSPTLFSFTLTVSFNGPKGRERREYPHIGVPIDIKGTDQLTRKMLSIIYDLIFKEIVPAIFGTYPDPRTTHDQATAEKILRDIKQTRGVKFKLRFYREVIHREASKETPRRLRGRLRGRQPNASVPLRTRRKKPSMERRDKAKRIRQTPRPGGGRKNKGKGR